MPYLEIGQMCLSERKIVCVTSTASLGCTFLDWSILWLSGQAKVFDIKTSKWHDICPNPLQQNSVTNAHKHAKNHRGGWARNKKILEQIYNETETGLVSLFPGTLHLDDCCQDLGFSIADLANESVMQQVDQYQKQDYVDMLDWMARDQQIPVIYVDFDPSIRGYKWTRRSLDRLTFAPHAASSQVDFENEHQDVFFSESQQRWRDIGLTQIWDIRERMALDIRPFSEQWSDRLLLTHDHFWVHCQDLWFDTESTVCAIMAWLGLDVNQSRLEHWLPIMRSWQQIHNHNLRFPRHLSKILRSIVNGVKHDLSWLSFEQEVIVQHCLIYQFGLNFKTWNLHKFPDCASQLHLLLEPNHHPVPTIY